MAKNKVEETKVEEVMEQEEMNEEVELSAEAEVTEETEPEKKSVLSKIGGGLKKIGPKVAIGAGIAGGLLVVAKVLLGGSVEDCDNYESTDSNDEPDVTE